MARFLVDRMCGGIRVHLRMCGHDAAFAPDRGPESDDELLTTARAEDRTILTRDRELASRSDEAILLETTETTEQLQSLAAAGVDLTLPEEPSRCGRCNGVLEAVDPSESTRTYAPDPAEESVRRCVDCGQCFWKGSHWDRVARQLPE